MAIIKKITVKNVCGETKKLLNGQKEKFAVMRVAGIIRSMHPDDGDFGTYVKFRGSFSATNLLTGEEFKSANCLLPDIAADLLESAMNEEGVNGLEFGFDVFVVPDDSIAIGYQYAVDSLIETAENDPLMTLINSLPSLPKIAAPKKETAKA